VKKRRQLLLRFRHITQQEIDHLNSDSFESTPEFEDAGGSTVLLASQLKDLSAALVLVERELASQGPRKLFH
jgi:hypothetical protein